MKLNDLRDNRGARTERMRVGRGIGSGKGKTSGRGVKGYKARSGSSVKAFEGGQMPLYMRLPKRGFTNIFREEYEPVNIGYLQALVEGGKIKAGAHLSKKELADLGLVRRSTSRVKLLAKGTLLVALSLEVDAASQKAIESVQKAGGSVRTQPKAEDQASQ